MGILYYLPRFVNNYSKLSYPIRQVLQKYNPFEWTVDCNLKQTILFTPTLGFYDIIKPFIISVDSSYCSIRGMLLQYQPIAYATRTLTKT